MVAGAVLNRPLIHRKAVLFVVVLVTVCRSLLCVSSRYGYSPSFNPLALALALFQRYHFVQQSSGGSVGCNGAQL